MDNKKVGIRQSWVTKDTQVSRWLDHQRQISLDITMQGGCTAHRICLLDADIHRKNRIWRHKKDLGFLMRGSQLNFK